MALMRRALLLVVLVASTLCLAQSQVTVGVDNQHQNQNQNQNDNHISSESPTSSSPRSDNTDSNKLNGAITPVADDLQLGEEQTPQQQSLAVPVEGVVSRIDPLMPAVSTTQQFIPVTDGALSDFQPNKVDQSKPSSQQQQPQSQQQQQQAPHQPHQYVIERHAPTPLEPGISSEPSSIPSSSSTASTSTLSASQSAASIEPDQMRFEENPVPQTSSTTNSTAATTTTTSTASSPSSSANATSTASSPTAATRSPTTNNTGLLSSSLTSSTTSSSSNTTRPATANNRTGLAALPPFRVPQGPDRKDNIGGAVRVPRRRLRSPDNDVLPFHRGFDGSAYDDLLDDVRLNFLSAAGRKNSVEEPGRLTRIMELLKQVALDVQKEQANADLLFDRLNASFQADVTRLEASIANSESIILGADNQTANNRQLLLNLTRNVRDAPINIPKLRAELHQTQRAFDRKQQARDDQNFMFRTRETYLRDNIVAVDQFLLGIGRLNNPNATLFNTTLDTVVTDQGLPMVRNLRQMLKDRRLPEDLDQLRVLLELLHKNFHDLLTIVIRREVALTNKWSEEEKVWRARIVSLHNQLNYWSDVVPNSSKQLLALQRANHKLKRTRAQHVDNIIAFRKRLNKLRSEFTPMEALYLNDQRERGKLAFKISSLVEFVNTRYNNETSLPSTAPFTIPQQYNSAT